jgi:hypothetical protein
MAEPSRHLHGFGRRAKKLVRPLVRGRHLGELLQALADRMQADPEAGGREIDAQRGPAGRDLVGAPDRRGREPDAGGRGGEHRAVDLDAGLEGGSTDCASPRG